MTHWFFKDCVVEDDSEMKVFYVYMVNRDGKSVTQTVFPREDEYESRRNALDEGSSPTTGWEDGLGKSVSPENAKETW